MDKSAPTGNPRSNYLQGDDGNWYNADGERVYYWVPPAETDSTINGDSETQGIGQDLGGYYTESEIKSAWDADDGMGHEPLRSAERLQKLSRAACTYDRLVDKSRLKWPYYIQILYD